MTAIKAALQDLPSSLANAFKNRSIVKQAAETVETGVRHLTAVPNVTKPKTLAVELAELNSEKSFLFSQLHRASGDELDKRLARLEVLKTQEKELKAKMPNPFAEDIRKQSERSRQETNDIIARARQTMKEFDERMGANTNTSEAEQVAEVKNPFVNITNPIVEKAEKEIDISDIEVLTPEEIMALDEKDLQFFTDADVNEFIKNVNPENIQVIKIKPDVAIPTGKAFDDMQVAPYYAELAQINDKRKVFNEMPLSPTYREMARINDGKKLTSALPTNILNDEDSGKLPVFSLNELNKLGKNAVANDPRLRPRPFIEFVGDVKTPDRLTTPFIRTDDEPTLVGGPALLDATPINHEIKIKDRGHEEATIKEDVIYEPTDEELIEDAPVFKKQTTPQPVPVKVPHSLTIASSNPKPETIAPEKRERTLITWAKNVVKRATGIGGKQNTTVRENAIKTKYKEAANM